MEFSCCVGCFSSVDHISKIEILKQQLNLCVVLIE